MSGHAGPGLLSGQHKTGLHPRNGCRSVLPVSTSGMQPVLMAAQEHSSQECRGDSFSCQHQFVWVTHFVHLPAATRKGLGVVIYIATLLLAPAETLLGTEAQPLAGPVPLHAQAGFQ